VNEGQIFLEYQGRYFLVYSASGCWSEWYCLGILGYTGGENGNVTDMGNWVKYPVPFFQRTPAGWIDGVGHCSFFRSPDGSEVWMAYHGMLDGVISENNRYLFCQSIGFDELNFPILGVPNRGVNQAVPSGQ